MKAVTLEEPPADAVVSSVTAQEHPYGYALGPSGYSKGCRCECCVEGRRRYNREWMRNKRQDGSCNTVNAREARQSIRYVTKRVGLTCPEIARRSGVNAGTVRKVANGQRKRIKPETLEAILGVDATVMVAPCVAVGHVLPLLDAMHDDAGMTWRQIANTLGHKDPNWLWGVRRRRKYIFGRSFRKIVVLYGLLAREGRVPNALLARLLGDMRL